MKGGLIVLCSFLVIIGGINGVYILGPQGESCSDVCLAKGMNCNPHILTGNDTHLFKQLGVNCVADGAPWWAEDQPAFITLRTDPNYGKCLGYTNVPGGVQCGAKFPASSRLCRCDDPNSYSRVATFGTGLSASYVDQVERTLFAWVLPTDTYGIITHLWITAPRFISNQTFIRFYIDGEETPSVSYFPPLACGSGFDDQTAPWGNEWFGKGANDGGWFNNFKIPFQKSIRVTYQRIVNGQAGGFYIMVRGAPYPNTQKTISLGPNLEIPSTAKLQVITTDVTVAPLTWVNLVDLPTSSGLMFMHSIAVQSGTMNFLEGCYHAYTPYNQEFPGTVLSTGTEDYFDSAWYFNAGQFRFPVSGFTHLETVRGEINWSAYRFHIMDPVRFESGFKFVWRNGDLLDPAGQKCYMEFNTGAVVGNPTVSHIMAYSWVYTW